VKALLDFPRCGVSWTPADTLPTLSSTGMVRAGGIALGEASGTKQPYGVRRPTPFAAAAVAVVAATPQKPLRADDPAMQNNGLDPFAG
jgi:hypothetical protein